MSVVSPLDFAILCQIAAARTGLARDALARQLHGAAVSDVASTASLADLLARGWVVVERRHLQLTPVGIQQMLQHAAAIAAALDPSPQRAEHTLAPSLPWVTLVQTEWISAISLNYAVEPAALAPLLPAPLEPEIFHDRAWVQVLISSLRDLRPPGLPALFGVCFYQVSYRAAVRYRTRSGDWRRGGYFIRSDTNHPLMRTIGNTLTEFKFHAFGLADMVMTRTEALLTIGVDPYAEFPHGRVVALFDTTPVTAPPATSLWRSLEELQEPLVDCYDAFGVDATHRFLYTLTIDREPWRAQFAVPRDVYCEYFDTGPLGGGRAHYDSAFLIAPCRYVWRPLKRESLT